MKAVICTKYGPPEVLQLQEVNQPKPKANELLIKIIATSVTASDCIVRGFKVPLLYYLPMGFALGFGKPRRPILGMVFAGVVEIAGANVKAFEKGDQVFGCDFDRFVFGMYAEYVCFPENGTIALKPANLSFIEAVAIPFGGLMALHFLKKGTIQQGQNVLIYGASGAIGSLAIQLAKYFGAKVTGVCSSVNIEMVKLLGADAVIDYKKEDFTRNGKLYDFIFNAVGKKKAKLNCKSSLTSSGKHVTVDDETPKIRVEDLNLLKSLAEAGIIKPVIDTIYSIEQIVDAHNYVDSGHKKGNVIITLNDTMETIDIKRMAKVIDGVFNTLTEL